VDCAANCHTKGCHLLCHDDVIGTRKVSYIIYLTDPEPKWDDRDGGRLELYDAVMDDAVSDNSEEGAGQHYVPEALPVKTLLPVFNSFAYFVVEPGKSFHSVQEVFCDRPRLSIQGKCCSITFIF
jgi:Rps23 Pro-64 3,4-dihydroxylase Tpa1-like proline 4-hydroxylase